MDQRLIAEILTSDSDEIADLKANTAVLDGFIELAKQIDALPDIGKRFYEESRSLFQATSTGRGIERLEELLSKFFGPPVKPAGKPLPRKLRKSASVKYLGGIEKEQSFFLLNLKTGEFYAALWPWRRNKAKIEIHLGYCSDWITDQDYLQLENLVRRSLSRNTFSRMDTGAGGQIHGISLPSFLQMAEMERANFSLHVTSGNHSGMLFLKDGALISARIGDRNGREAAYRIISWDNASIEIMPADESKTDEIKQPLMHVLMESLKMKDEAASDDGPPQPIPSRPRPRPGVDRKLVRLERAPMPRRPNRSVRPVFLLILVVVLIGIAGVGLVMHLHLQNTRKVEDGYREVMRRVDQTAGLEEKLLILQQYQTDHPRSPHREQIETRLGELRAAVQEHDFEHITLQISNLEINETYEPKAISMYAAFLEKYPDSHYAERITKSLTDIKDLLDQYYYEDLHRAARLDFGARLKIYRDYLNRFPDGRYRPAVETLILEMGRRQLGYLKTELEQCENNQRWESCIARSEDFAGLYGGTPLEAEAVQFKNAAADSRDLAHLRKTAAALGTDYQKAYLGYKSYLDEHPRSTQRQAIQAEMAQLETKLATQRSWLAVQSFGLDPQNSIARRLQKVEEYLRSNPASPYILDAQSLHKALDLEGRTSLRQRQLATRQQEDLARLQREQAEQEQRQKRIQQVRTDLESQLGNSPRFRSNTDGTVIDLKTGLTWCLLDAYQELGGCVTFQNAQNYVRTLRHGGYQDWRLPTASELAAIYKQPPFFPSSGENWYWTSESYVKGYHNVANIVTAEPKTVFERESRSLDECGGVRAVRP